jgi:hypothetical protein
MEISGCFGGTLDLAIAAGINFPLHAMDTGKWLRTLWEFGIPRPGVKSDLRVSDPLPLIAEILYAWKRIQSSRFGRFRNIDELSRINAFLTRANSGANE